MTWKGLLKMAGRGVVASELQKSLTFTALEEIMNDLRADDSPAIVELPAVAKKLRIVMEDLDSFLATDYVKKAVDKWSRS